MSDFAADDRWQRAMRDRFIVPYYERNCPGRYQLVDDLELQKRGVDTLIDGRERVVWIDEKVVRWVGCKYTAFALETMSCTVPGREKAGWMVYSEVDWLLYCFEQEKGKVLECWWVNFKVLQRWFHAMVAANVNCFAEFRMRDTINKTRGRVVPIDMVRVNVPCRRFLLSADGSHV